MPLRVVGKIVITELEKYDSKTVHIDKSIQHYINKIIASTVQMNLHIITPLPFWRYPKLVISWMSEPA